MSCDSEDIEMNGHTVSVRKGFAIAMMLFGLGGTGWGITSANISRTEADHRAMERDHSEEVARHYQERYADLEQHCFERQLDEASTSSK